jgi:hypothetical protein
MSKISEKPETDPKEQKEMSPKKPAAKVEKTKKDSTKKEMVKISIKETIQETVIVSAEMSGTSSENSEDSDLDEDMDLVSSGSSGGETAEEGMLAMAKAGAVDSSPGSLKNFRHHPDIENFYRFVYENDLRYEALAIIDELTLQKQLASKVSSERKRAH